MFVVIDTLLPGLLYLVCITITTALMAEIFVFFEKPIFSIVFNTKLTAGMSVPEKPINFIEFAQ